MNKSKPKSNIFSQQMALGTSKKPSDLVTADRSRPVSKTDAQLSRSNIQPQRRLSFVNGPGITHDKDRSGRVIKKSSTFAMQQQEKQLPRNL